jgi:hypothetical protein
MEANFINTLFSGAESPMPSRIPGSQGKGSDGDSFLSILKSTIDVTQVNKPQLKGRACKDNADGGTSADALSKSLDIMDALAFLPILLAMQPRANGVVPSDSVDCRQEGPDSKGSVNDFLSAITTALQTGNMEKVKKVLEGNETLKGILLGQQGAPDDLLPAFVAAQPQTDGKVPLIAESRPVDPASPKTSLRESLTSILAVLQTGNDEEVEKVMEENKDLIPLLSAFVAAQPQTDGKVPLIAESRPVDPASPKTSLRESLIKTLTVLAKANAQEIFQRHVSEEPEEPVDALTSDEKAVSPKGSQSMAASVNTTSVPMGEDVVRNTLLLSSILPNLATIKPQINTTDEKVQSDAGYVTRDSLASLISALQAGDAGKTIKPGEGKEERAAKVRLTEDYVLLDANKANQDKAAPETSKPLFDVVKTNPKVGAENTLEGSADLEKTAQQAPLPAPSSNSIRHGTGQPAGKQTVGDESGIYGVESADKDMSLTNKLSFAVSTGEKEGDSAFQRQKGRYKVIEDKSNVSIKKGDYTFPSGDEAMRADTRQGKEPAGVSERGTFVSTMTHKIEEMAEKLANRTQPMDMILRLKIDDKESLVVGLKEQGNRLIVEVKSASESLTGLLQLHKDAITRELENKQIYATINVDPNGEGDLQRRGQRDRGRRNAEEEEKKAFLGILDGLG